MEQEEQLLEHEERECSILDRLPSGEMETDCHWHEGEGSVVVMFTSYHGDYLNSRRLGG